MVISAAAWSAVALLACTALCGCRRKSLIVSTVARCAVCATILIPLCARLIVPVIGAAASTVIVTLAAVTSSLLTAGVALAAVVRALLSAVVALTAVILTLCALFVSCASLLVLRRALLTVSLLSFRALRAFLLAPDIDIPPCVSFLRIAGLVYNAALLTYHIRDAVLSAVILKFNGFSLEFLVS